MDSKQISVNTILRTVILAIYLILSFVVFNLPGSVNAAPIPDGCPGSSNPAQPAPNYCADIPLGCPGSSLQGPVASPPTNCPYEASTAQPPTNQLSTECKTLDDCRIIGYLRDFINILSVVVGIVVVIMIGYGGVRYSMSRDNPQETAAAKKHITNAITALVVFIFTFAILEYLVPGGVF